MTRLVDSKGIGDSFAEKYLVRKIPSAAQISSWVRQAKALPLALHY